MLAVCAVALLSAPGWIDPPRAEAHPLGNFTISRYSRIELTPGLARIRYVVDMAEIPTFQQRSAIDSNRDGAIDEQEAAAYANKQGEVLVSGVRLMVDGQTVPLRLSESAVSFPEGQGGLDTLRL